MLLRLLGSLALATPLLLSQVRKPDFSGTWKPDPSKSSFKLTPVKNPDPSAPDVPPPPPPNEQAPEVIDQKDNALKIGELAFTLDGREIPMNLAKGCFKNPKRIGKGPSWSPNGSWSATAKSWSRRGKSEV